jgi:flagellar biosynthetic protein FlhB
MSDDSAQEKTEDPTPRRRQKFRERGEVATSKELAAGIMLFASTASIWMFIHLAAKPVAVKLRKVWSMTDNTQSFVSAPTLYIGELSTSIVMNLIPVFAVTFIAGILSYVVQTGFIWTAEPMKPSFSSLNPIKGVQKLFFSKDTLANLAKSLFKVVLIGFVTVLALYMVASDVLSLVRKPPIALAGYLEKIAIYPLFACSATMIVLGVADFIWQKYQMEEKMKMTPREKKRERKETEGDPHLNQKREDKHRELLDMNQLINEVPESDVVVNNPTHYSVALKYEPDKGAPWVVAKGKDRVAKKIRDIAEEHDIPQVENPPLARALHANVDEEEHIPEQFFRAVANVLAYVWQQQGHVPDHIN